MTKTRLWRAMLLEKLHASAELGRRRLFVRSFRDDCHRASLDLADHDSEIFTEDAEAEKQGAGNERQVEDDGRGAGVGVDVVAERMKRRHEAIESEQCSRDKGEHAHSQPHDGGK